MTPRGQCNTPSLLPAMCVCGVGLSSVLLYRQELCCVGQWYAFSPPLRLWDPPPLCMCAPVLGLLVVVLLVFGLLGWLLGLLVGCWTADFGWLGRRWVGWLVSCLVGCWLVDRVYVCVCVCVCVCTGVVALYVVLGGVYVCVCCMDRCCVGSLHNVFVCKHACEAIARVTGGVLHISFWRSSEVF